MTEITPWIQIFTGKRLDLNSPNPDQIDIQILHHGYRYSLENDSTSRCSLGSVGRAQSSIRPQSIQFMFHTRLRRTCACWTAPRCRQSICRGGSRREGAGCVRAIEEGLVLAAGKLSVNLSCGLKTKGHPVGATGISMYVLCLQCG